MFELGSNERSKEMDFLNTYNKLKNYCYFLTKNEWDGNDLAQETITKAVQHYKHSTVLHQALLQKIAYHKWIDIVRKRQKEFLTDRVEEAGHFPLEPSLAATDYLLNNLTPKQAVVYFLKEAFDFQTAEIADILKTTEGAVKSTLHRSRKRLEKGDTADNEFVKSFWTEEERVLLPQLFEESLREEDPYLLIEALPTILATVSNQATPAHTPTNIYACAA